MHDPDPAFYWSLWRAILAAILATVLMACYGASATNALLIGANVALLYALGMMLSARSIYRPRARSHIPVLRFAEAGSAIAIALSSAALAVRAAS